MRHSFVPVFAALTLGMALPVNASELAVEVTIPHGDLDLTDPADFEAMEARITKMVDKACTRKSTASTSGRYFDRLCATEAKETAMAELKRKQAQRLAMAHD